MHNQSGPGCATRHTSLPRRSFERRAPSSQVSLPSAPTAETLSPSFRKSPAKEEGIGLGEGEPRRPEGAALAEGDPGDPHSSSRRIQTEVHTVPAALRCAAITSDVIGG